MDLETDSSEFKTIKLFLLCFRFKTHEDMKLITITFICFLAHLSIAQDCNFLPADTLVCGFIHSFNITNASGDFFYECEMDKPFSISTLPNGQTQFTFSECGEYELVFESDADNCLDTFLIQVSDPSNTITSIQTAIELGYGDIDCPDNVFAECYSNSVSIPISSGIPEEVWSFCTTATCQSTTYTSEIVGNVDGCLADSIGLDTISISDSSQDCIDTNQDAFIILNSDGDMVDNNTFLTYLAQLQSSLDIDCQIITDDCGFGNGESCYDSTVMDTSYLHIPVRIGGKWTLANIDSGELFDTTYFEYFGRDYELILDPGVEYYGPGNLDVYLYEIFITTSNDTIKNFPYGFYLQLQWEEEWIIDTLELIREIPFDSDEDCFACGGNLFNAGFNVPGIPPFPCGPISIYYPDICECEYQYPDYSLQLVDCYPKAWQVDILSGHYIDPFGSDAFILGNNNSFTIMYPGSENIDLHMFDYNGCEYIVPITLDALTELIHISYIFEELSCENPEMEISVFNTYFVWDNNMGVNLEFDNPPVWTMPNGETQMGESITVSEPGTYHVEYTDNYGCLYEDDGIVVYNDDEFVYQEHVILCGGETTIFNGQTINQSGVYTFEIDCNESTVLTVEQYDVIEYSESFVVCEGETIDVHGQNLTSGIYDIDITNGTPCPDIVHVEVVESFLNMDWLVSNTCEGTAILTLTFDQSVFASISHDEIIEGEYTITENGLVVELLDSGLYTVLAANNGCEKEFPIYIDLMQYEITLPQEEMIDCDNNCIELSPEITNLKGVTSASDYEISWTGPEGFVSSGESIEVCEGGNYSIHLSYGDNCITSQSIFVNQDLEPEIQFIAANLCYGECYDDGTYYFCQTTQTTIDVDDCNRIEVNVTIEEEIISEKSYSLCEGESIEIGNINYDQEGIFISVFISEAGCDSTLNFSIDILERGEIVTDNIIDCKHSDALLTYTPLNDIESYTWLDDSGFTLSNDLEYLASEPGFYFIEVTVEGNGSTCTFIEQIELMENIVIPEFNLDGEHTINCEATAKIDINLEEGSTWVWQNESLGINIENEELEAEAAGIYTLTVMNEEGCTATKSIEIFKVEPIEVNFTTSATCEDVNEGVFIVDKIEGGIPPYTIMLDDEEIEESTLDLSPGVHMLRIEQADGCQYEEEVMIESIPNLDEVPVQNLEFCNSSGITITLNLDDQISYNWLDGFESNVRPIRQEGVYDVEFSNGCNTIVSTYYIDDTRVENRYTVSNIFSPDGNSVNDRMKVVPHVDVEDFKLFIFSRDGSLVFESTDPHIGWDGKIGGNNVVIGSYVWLIQSNIITCGGEVENTQDVGTVMVIF